MSDYLPCIEIEPRNGPADASVIWLHGLGASGHDFEPIVPQLQLPASLSLRFVLPHAPSIPVTLNGGYVMPAWFDILALSEAGERSFNASQLLASAVAVHALIDREVERGIASERIILAGFSQGGAVNYQAGLTYDKPLGGILALSSYFPTAKAVELHPANHRVPILICHGTQDPVLPLPMGEASHQALRSLGLHPEFKTYVMQHTVSLEEVQDIAEWLEGLLS